MVKRMIAASLVALALLVGCSKPSETTTPSSSSQKQVVNLSVQDLLKRYKAGEKLLIVDVRTPEEFAAGHIEGALLSPLQNVEEGVKKIAKDQQIILICRSGNRSLQAYNILAGLGYTNLINVTGGMIDWEKAGGPVVK